MRMTTDRRPERSDVADPTESGRSAFQAVGFGAACACAGSLAAYFLDPNQGRTRRARLRDKAVHATHRLNRGVGVVARDCGNRSRGVVAGVRYKVDGRKVGDEVLHERVRAELGRYVRHPHAVDVSVEDHVVKLSGDVRADEDQRARHAVAKIPGVQEVDAGWTAHEDLNGVPQLQGEGRRREPVPELRQEHWSPTARLMVGSVGGLLLSYAGRLPRPLVLPVRATGGVLMTRAITNLPMKRLTGVTAGRRAVDVEAAITVAAPPENVWALVSEYEWFPSFMPDVREVRRTNGERTTHWVLSGPTGTAIGFDAEETKREEGRESAWRTCDGQLIAHSGSLRLDPEREGTRIQVRLTYNPIAGAAGHAVATLLGANPRRKLIQDLRRLKTAIETSAGKAAPAM